MANVSFSFMLLTGASGLAAEFANQPSATALPAIIDYESFGAKGDGIADDLAAICKAHDMANSQGLPVRSKPGATYHLGTKALTAVIATDTDWGTSRFIIDDSAGVENPKKPLFEVRSLVKPQRLEITKLSRTDQRLPIQPKDDCVVYVENRNKSLFVRKGPNRNSGSPQKEVFILRRSGVVEGGIDWDYDTITRVEAMPIDPNPLILKGGIFTQMANRDKPSKDSGYWARNIEVRRSNTVVDGLVFEVRGEGEYGQPYSGSISASKCANIVLRNCVVDGRKAYRKMGRGGAPVMMGTYGYGANLVINLRMLGCRMGNDIHDTSRWGVVATNFMKNFLVDGCILSRVDVHQGVSGSYIIRNTTLGHAGINAIGRGRLLVENSTLQSKQLVRFREDYGSSWNGDVVIRNSKWEPGGGSGTPVMFRCSNDGSHDFGYPCSMPVSIVIDGLHVDDSKYKDSTASFSFFGNPLGKTNAKVRSPYEITRSVSIRGLETSTGRPYVVSENHKVAEKVRLIRP